MLIQDSLIFTLYIYIPSLVRSNCANIRRDTFLFRPFGLISKDTHPWTDFTFIFTDAIWILTSAKIHAFLWGISFYTNPLTINDLRHLVTHFLSDKLVKKMLNNQPHILQNRMYPLPSEEAGFETTKCCLLSMCDFFFSKRKGATTITVVTPIFTYSSRVERFQPLMSR